MVVLPRVFSQCSSPFVRVYNNFEGLLRIVIQFWKSGTNNKLYIHVGKSFQSCKKTSSNLALSLVVAARKALPLYRQMCLNWPSAASKERLHGVPKFFAKHSHELKSGYVPETAGYNPPSNRTVQHTDYEFSVWTTWKYFLQCMHGSIASNLYG